MNRVTQSILALTAVSILVGASLIMSISFPFRYTSIELEERPSIPDSSYDEITKGVSQFLWNYRGLDLVSQSFVVLVAVISCLAMLKYERGNK